MATRRNSSLSLPQNNILSSDGWNLCPRCCICWCALPNYNSHFYNAIPRVVQTRRKKKGRWKDMNPSAGFVWKRERKLLKRRTQLVHRWLCETLFDPRSTCFRLAWQNNKLLSVFLPHSNTEIRTAVLHAIFARCQQQLATRQMRQKSPPNPSTDKLQLATDTWWRRGHHPRLFIPPTTTKAVTLASQYIWWIFASSPLVSCTDHYVRVLRYGYTKRQTGGVGKRCFVRAFLSLSLCALVNIFLRKTSTKHKNDEDLLASLVINM